MSIKLGVNLADLRKKNGFSQEALAEKLGISRQAVSKWERGESTPDTDTLITLAELYNVSLDELIGNRTQPTIAQKTEQTETKTETMDAPLYPGLSKKLLVFPFPVLIVVIYIFLGLSFRLWHPMWFIFLLIPAYYHFAIGVRAKTKKGLLMALPIFEAALIIFLLTGIYFSMWKYGWILLVFALGYYWWAGMYAGKK